MTIRQIDTNKRQYIPLLLVGDESERMIERYIDEGELHVGFLVDRPIAVCVTLKIDDNTIEVKNLAVDPNFQHKGYGRLMLTYAERHNEGKRMLIGTGETPSTLRFYTSCGYKFSHRVADFFIDNYDHPIIEEGVLLRDMVYLEKQA